MSGKPATFYAAIYRGAPILGERPILGGRPCVVKDSGHPAYYLARFDGSGLPDDLPEWTKLPAYLFEVDYESGVG